MSYILDALKKSEQEREQKQTQDNVSISHHAMTLEGGSLQGVGDKTQVQTQKTGNKSENTASNQPRHQEKLDFLNSFLGSWLIKIVYLLLISLAVVVLMNIFSDKNESSLKSIEIDQNEQLATELSHIKNTEKLTSSSKEENLLNTNTQITHEIEPQGVATAVIREPSNNTESSGNAEFRENTQFSATNSSQEESAKAQSIAIEEAAEEVVSDLPIMNISSHIFSTQADRRSIVVNGQRLVEGSFVTSGVKVLEITHQGMIIQVKDHLLVVSRSRGWK